MLYVYLWALKKGGYSGRTAVLCHTPPPPPPPRLITFGGAGSVEKKIDLYNIHVNNPGRLLFIVFPDLEGSV